MKTKIELYKGGQRLVYVVKMGPVVKIFKSKNNAHKYLEDMGFEYNYQEGYYEKKYMSKQEVELSRQYKKFEFS